MVALKRKRKREESSRSLDRPPPFNCFPHQKPKRKKNNQSAEVLALTYGALVRQLVADLDDVADVNARLDTM